MAQVQADLAITREERRYLIKRLMRHEGLEAIQEQQAMEQVEIENAQPKKRGPKKRIQPVITTTTTVKPTVVIKQEKQTVVIKQEKQTRTTRPRDKFSLDAAGKPIYPINLGGTLILHMSGEIVSENPNFHSQNWIYPVGYVATRIFAHPKDPQRKCVYTCKILNNAGTPQFQLIPDNDFDSVFFGETAAHCHQGLLEALQRASPDIAKLALRTQGERFFGLGSATVMSLMQADPNYQRCANFKGFLVDGGYASEDKDPTLNFEALQSLISISSFAVPEVKDEPPDELLE